MTKAGRIDAFAVSSEATGLMMKLEGYFLTCGIELSLIELVKTRVSQMNGCAHCIDLHSRRARLEGVSEQKIYLLDAWREAAVYSPRERAALEWAEELTDIAERRASDQVFASVRPHFDDRELSDLTLLIGQINSWNRLSIGFRNEFVGDDEPRLSRHR